MSKLADKIRQDLTRAIDQDELALLTLPEVALQAREAAEDLDVSIQVLSKVIDNDAALTVHIIRVVNSLLLYSPKETTNPRMTINRSGINYTCNLVTGLTMEQIFQATTDVVDRKMRKVWDKGTETTDICHVLARHYTRLAPDQATLVGLMHQIGVLSILTYAEDHNELLSDSISLSHAIERIHSLIGKRILKVQDFPAPIAEVPCQHLDFTRNSPRVNYTDLIQIVTLQSYLGSEHPYTCLDWSQISAFAKLGPESTVDMKEDENLSSVLEAVTSMLQ